jgi:hypothetical protein
LVRKNGRGEMLLFNKNSTNQTNIQAEVSINVRLLRTAETLLVQIAELLKMKYVLRAGSDVAVKNEVTLAWREVDLRHLYLVGGKTWIQFRFVF